MKLISAESIRRPEVVRWHNRLIERYSPPPDIVLSVLLPCSSKKPYSKSKSHMIFRKHIRTGAKAKYPLVHEVVLTSPLGLVPRELEDVYPAAHYDVPVTGAWSEEEKEIVRKLLNDYMRKSTAPIIAHVEGTYKEICEGLSIETTSGDTSHLENLVAKRLKKIKRTSSLGGRLKKVRAVCDFQFGGRSYKELLGDRSSIKGFQVQNEKGELLATIDRYSGFLALSLKGGERLHSTGRYIVELSFKPESGSVFCVGIDRADYAIRPKDEVIATYRGRVVGVGKAVLSGVELERAKKGLGLTLRHRRR
jgi:archaeosine synthase